MGAIKDCKDYEKMDYGMSGSWPADWARDKRVGDTDVRYDRFYKAIAGKVSKGTLQAIACFLSCIYLCGRLTVTSVVRVKSFFLISLRRTAVGI